MTIIKGILTYTLIFIGLVIGVGVILVGIMYFFPSVSVFGYKFYQGNDRGTIYEIIPSADKTGTANGLIYIDKAITDKLDAVEIVAKEFDVNVKIFKGSETSTQSFRVEFTKSISGFVEKNSDGPTFTIETKKKCLTGESVEKNVVTFTVNEPKGLYLNRNAHITVWVADNICGGKLNDLRIESGKGSINFEQGYLTDDKTGDPNLNINNVTVKDKADTLEIKHINILNALTINAESCNFSIDRALACDINLDCKKGKFKFGDINRKIASEKAIVKIDAVNADVQFNDIDGDVHLTSDYGFFRANKIIGNFSSLSHNITDINNACDIDVKRVDGTTIIQNDSGKIVLGQVGLVTEDVALRIDTKSGNVTVSNCFAKTAEINSTRGSVQINNALCDAEIVTTYGSVNIEFMADNAKVEGVADADVANAITALKTKKLDIKTGNERGDGTITAKNIRGQATLNSGGSGNVVAHFLNLTGVNEITSSRGGVEVVVPQKVETAVTGGVCTGFWLDWKANKSADIKILTFKETKVNASGCAEYNNKEGIKAVYVGGLADESNPTKMTVKANNNVKIYDASYYAM